jgi:hypothetical protein
MLVVYGYMWMGKGWKGYGDGWWDGGWWGLWIIGWRKWFMGVVGVMISLF